MRFIEKFDKLFTIVFLLLLIIGIMAVYSVSNNADITVFYKHLFWIGISFIVFIILQYIPIKVIFASSYLLFALNIIVIVLLTILQNNRFSGIDEITIFSKGFLKITFILFLARFVSNRKFEINSIKIIAMSIFSVLVVSYLLLIQHSSGNAIIIILSMMIILYLSDMKYEHLFFVVSLFISFLIYPNLFIWIPFIIIFIVCLYILKANIFIIISGIFCNIISGLISPYIRTNFLADKIRIMMNKGDIHGFGWNLLQSKIAIGSGGFAGKGFLKGTQKGLDMIQGQESEFIFSVIGEEIGFIGLIIIGFLYFMLLLRTIFVSNQIRINFSKLIALTFSVIIISEMIMNIAFSIGLLPFGDVLLPFISYSGIYLLTSSIMAAIVNRIIVSRLDYW